MQLNLIELKGKDKSVPMEWDIPNIVSIVREFCGDDFAYGLEVMLIELKSQADYTEQKIHTDLDCYEMDIEQMRRDIVANVSHELRTPLTSIIGFVKGIIDGIIPKEDHEKYLSIVFPHNAFLILL